MDQEEIKKVVGYYATDKYISNNMLVGLGTGSTAKYVVERLGQKLKSGELVNVVGIPTSDATKKQAESLGIPLVTLDERCGIDVAIDGADEIDSQLNLVKGRGGALLREKLIAEDSGLFVVVADPSKICSEGLGANGAFPVEINKFCSDYVKQKIQMLSCLPAKSRAVLRPKTKDSSEPFETDNQNYILDLYFDEPLKNPTQVAEELIKIVGVVEHGLFLNLAQECLIGQPNGEVQVLNPVAPSE